MSGLVWVAELALGKRSSCSASLSSMADRVEMRWRSSWRTGESMLACEVALCLADERCTRESSVSSASGGKDVCGRCARCMALACRRRRWRRTREEERGRASKNGRQHRSAADRSWEADKPLIVSGLCGEGGCSDAVKWEHIHKSYDPLDKPHPPEASETRSGRPKRERGACAGTGLREAIGGHRVMDGS